MEIKKRESWETEEIKYFLHLIRERQVMKCLDNKKFCADKIFKYLEKGMHEKGYKKNWKQMQTRFKTLRQQYDDIKRKMGKSRSGNYLSSFPYAIEMSELLDSRPIAIEEGIDSCDLSEDSNDLNNTNSCVPEDPLSIFLNEKNDSNDFVYEDTPDPRDGAIPSCSKDTCEIITQNSLGNLTSNTCIKNDSSTDSSSSNICTKRQKSKSRSYENIIKYADKMKEIYEINQENIMIQTKECVSKLIKSEKEMMDKMLDSHRTILKETTNQLLCGLQNIFGVATARTVNTQMIPSIVLSFNETVPYLYPTGELQQFQSAANLPKVLINLKRPVGANEEAQKIKIQKSSSYSNNNSAKEVLTTKDTITSSNIHVNDISHL